MIHLLKSDSSLESGIFDCLLFISGSQPLGLIYNYFMHVGHLTVLERLFKRCTINLNLIPILGLLTPPLLHHHHPFPSRP